MPPWWVGGKQPGAAEPERGHPAPGGETPRPRPPNPFTFGSSGVRGLLRRLRPGIVDIQEEPYSLATASILHQVRREVPHAKICIYTAQNVRKRYPPPFGQFERRALRQASAIYPCSQDAATVIRTKGY